jgi:HPt (histidine-containing phosphotransfer) domain-containing protein
VTKPFEEEKLIGAIYKLTNFDAKKSVVIEEMQNDSQQKLYNLNQLLSISRNDLSYCKKMIGIFIEQSSISISQINEAYEAKNLDAVYNVAHRIKPSIDLMGIEMLRDTIRFIEKNAKDLNDSEDLKKQIEILFTVLNKVIFQLKEEELYS